MPEPNAFQIEYDRLLELIEAKLEEFVDDSEPASLYEPFKYIMQGRGKRIRPALTLLACGAINSEPTDALAAGCALEVLHNFTLVHDDIMDKSPMRRGRETIHTKWDESVAILSGDMMVGWAYRFLCEHSSSPRFSAVVEAFTDGLIEVCEGQGYDMQIGSGSEVNLDDYILMIEKKTSRLLQSAVKMGANLAGATQEQIEALDNFARSVGIAFQIQDDLLDMIAEQSKFGKKIGQDVFDGKKTYLIIKASSSDLSEDDRSLLDKFFTLNSLPEEDLPALHDLFERNGIYNDAETEAKRWFDIANDSLDELPEGFYRNMLGWLVDNLNTRKY
ncbi:MAG: polyprenyl synthetase family protein [Chloroflexota bacterium]